MMMQIKLLTLPIILLAIAGLLGCKHPLAIVGEGDIVEVGHSGRGCTLEQFRAGDSACTDNDVSGDYFVNYKAVPRPGWRFVRWEGPCPADSAFQHCKFAVAEEAVAWWEETYPNREIAPSTAVFQPIEGETGYLRAGTAVAGITYETPTQQGVTGLDGSFQYTVGETVRFRIGGTVLGQVTGQEQVTPFDLTGSPIQTGTHITWALQDPNDPYHVLINLTVLLHSLDDDGDPENGIVIRAGVASLLNGISLSLRKPWDGGLEETRIDEEPLQPWLAFNTDPTFRHVLGRASRTQRFSTPHGIAERATTMTSLYRGLGIEPNVVGLELLLTRQQGEPEQLETLYYDDNGNITRHENTGFPGAYEIWQYDALGKVTRHELHGTATGPYEVDTWQYDVSGNLTRSEIEGTGGTVRSFLYDIDGNPVQKSWAANRTRNPIIENYHYQYDKRGRLSQFTAQNDDGFQRWRFNAQGKVGYWEDQQGSSEARSYDSNGNLITIKSSSFPGSPETGEYNSDGKLVRWQQENTWCDRTCFRLAQIWEYDESNRVTLRKLLNLEDDSVLEMDSWQYDQFGRVLSRTGDPFSGDQTITETWQYNADGAVVRHRITDGNFALDNRYDPNGRLTYERLNDDGAKTTQNWSYDTDDNLRNRSLDRGSSGVINESTTYQYTATGWSHLFSGITIYGLPRLAPIKPSPAQEESPPDNACIYQTFFHEIDNC